MADTDEAPQGPHGPAIAGKGGSGPLAFLHGAHRQQIIVICSVVGVLLMWLTLRKTGGQPAATPAGQAQGLAGAGAVTGFDQAAADQLMTSMTDQNTMLGQIQMSMDNQTAAIATETDGLKALGNQITGLPQQIITALPKPSPVTVSSPPHAPAPPAATPPPAGPTVSGPQYYTVRSGDTLSGIASRYRESWITPGSIGGLNGIHNLNLIHPGQNLRIY